jgi:hypothetical protein
MIPARNHQMIIGDAGRPGDPAREFVLQFIAAHTGTPPGGSPAAVLVGTVVLSHPATPNLGAGMYDVLQHNPANLARTLPEASAADANGGGLTGNAILPGSPHQGGLKRIAPRSKAPVRAAPDSMIQEVAPDEAMLTGLS